MTSGQARYWACLGLILLVLVWGIVATWEESPQPDRPVPVPTAVECCDS